jgi:DsbC/DsbD-like thiol-disulfide interchange protein
MPLVKLTSILVFLFAAAATHAQDVSHVQATAMADVASIAPGKPFKIGVEFKIDPGWHIYWLNPGDSGLPTRLIVDLPAGYTAGPLEYPTPKRIALPGNIVNYGYEDDVLLTMTITPPASVPAGTSVTIPVRATWLVCQEECLPGSSSLSIALPAGDGKPSADADLFRTWAAEAPMSSSPEVVSCRPTYTPPVTGTDTLDAAVAVEWKTAAPADIQLAPKPIDGWDVADIKTETAGNKTVTRFHLRKAGSVSAPANFGAILLFKNHTGHPVGLAVGFGSVDVTTRPAA